MPKNGRRRLGKYVDIGGWGLGKKEGGGVFEWGEGEGMGGLIPPQCTLCNRYFHDGNFMPILKSFQAQGVAKKYQLLISV